MHRTHYDTYLTPFQYVLGYKSTDSPAVDNWFQSSEQVWESTHQCLEQVAQSNKESADRHRGENSHYQPRDRVWLATSLNPKSAETKSQVHRPFKNPETTK